jgi:aspartyl-tRNA(Asn)/glutamyl-tRNA(Gln) amidotransferase subunit A
VTAGSDALPAGSTAADAFSDSARVLHAYEPSDAARPPAFTYVPPAGTPTPWPRHTGLTHEVSDRDVLSRARLRLASGEQSALELLDECALAIDKRDAELVAFAELHLETARTAAAHADRVHAAGGSLGPLHGIPVTVKDVIHVGGMTTRCGSVAYEHRPEQDAAPVARLRAAGAVIVGKVTTHEFALGVTSPQSRNPHDVSRIPGGSSGGSAISVATGMALGSLGTDTRASIRVPAALSGVVGLKPTFGTVPTAGIVPLSWTMDHAAPMARTARDAAVLLDVLADAGGSIAEWADAAVDGWRLGAPPAAFEGCDAAVATAIDAALSVVRSLGCAIESVDAPTARHLEEANAAGLFVSRCEAAAFHRTIRGELTRYWPEVGDQLVAATALPAVDYLDAQRLRADLGAVLLAAFAEVDLLVMPTVPVVAPPLTDFARYLMVLSRNAIPWSFLGFPAISIPCGTDAGGLPVGIQFVGPPHHDGPVIAMAAALERALRS